MTDTDLLQQLSALDAEAISQIHERYFPEVYRYARYRLGNPDRAEDVAAEAFLRLLEAAHAHRGPRQNLRGWLMRTTSNIVNDAFRASYRHPQQPLDEALEQPDPVPEAAAAQAEEVEDLRQALAGLTEEQQHVISLRFGAELSLRETAAVMDKGINAIKSLQYRAVAALREQLEGAGS